MKQDITSITQRCIHYIMSRSKESIPQPVSTSIHVEKPNEVFHIDFLYMVSPKGNDLRYTLHIMNDLGSYLSLVGSASEGNEIAKYFILKGIAYFGYRGSWSEIKTDTLQRHSSRTWLVKYTSDITARLAIVPGKMLPWNVSAKRHSERHGRYYPNGSCLQCNGWQWQKRFRRWLINRQWGG